MTEIFKRELYKNNYFPKEITKIILNYVYIEYNNVDQQRFTWLLEKYIKLHKKLSLLSIGHNDKSLMSQHLHGTWMFLIENNGILFNNPTTLYAIRSLKNSIDEELHKLLFYPFSLYKEFDDLYLK